VNFKRSLVFLLLFLIVSCGGGGGGSESDSGTAPTPTPAPTLSFTSNQTSVNVGESITLTWSSSNTSGCSASGYWTGSKSTSGNESIVIESIGSQTFTLSCSGSGGTTQASVSVSGDGFTGVVVDGYIRDATVFLDTNNNLTQDVNESNTTSDSSGSFILTNSQEILVAVDGIDVDSNNNLENYKLLQKRSGGTFRAITPLTTLDYFISESSSINAILGIDASININSTDPIASISENDSYKYLYEKGSQVTALIFSLQSAINEIKSTQESSEIYFEELATLLEENYVANDSAVDIEDSSFIEVYVDRINSRQSVNIDSSSLVDIKTSLASLLPVISVRNDPSITRAIANFTTGKFISDFKDLAQNRSTSGLADSYLSDINSLIAEDQGVNLTDLEINMTLSDDSATLDEDQTINVLVLNNDTLSVGTDYYGFFMEFTSPTNGQVLLNSDYSISYVPNENFNGSDSFTYTITVDGSSQTAIVNLTVTPVNDGPIFENLSDSYSISEGQTGIAIISVNDVEGEQLTFSVSGADSSSVNISSTGVLTFSEVTDYETKSSYSVTIEVSDGTDTSTKDIVINILNVVEETNPPVLQSWSVNPTSADTSNSPVTITVSVNVTDESGVDQNKLPLMELYLSSAYGTTHQSTRVVLDSGDSTNGTYKASLTIPQASLAGSWTIVVGRFEDINGITMTDGYLVTNIEVISNP
jgi:hypothetical protein